MEGSDNSSSSNKLSQVYKFVFGSLESRLFNTVLRLGICDLLEDGPKSYKELATITNSPQDGMIRIMRYFTYQGLFIQDQLQPDIFSKSSINSLFIKSSIYYQLANLFSGDSYYDLYRSIPDSFMNHEPGIPKALGVNDTWDILESNENNEKFKQAMVGITMGVIDDILKYCDFTSSKIIVDVGGSHGILLKAILNKYPTIESGINFDLEKVISTLQSSDDTRLSNVPGSFFESVPSADTYILRQIIHDWPDKECLKILNVISKSIKPGGRIYIFDSIIDHNNYDIDSLCFDAKMFHFFRSKERTLQEFNQLIDPSPFKIEQIFSFKCGGLLLTKK